MRVLALAALLSLAGYATAHGYVPFIKINGELIPGWDVALHELQVDGYKGRLHHQHQDRRL